MSRPPKLDPARRQEIVRRYVAGEAPKLLHAEYGVDHKYLTRHVTLAQRRQRWANVKQREQDMLRLYYLGEKTSLLADCYGVCVTYFKGLAIRRGLQPRGRTN